MNIYPIAAALIIIVKGLSGLYLFLRGTDLLIEGETPVGLTMAIVGFWIYVTAWPHD